jgi:hypothetical protein
MRFNKIVLISFLLLSVISIGAVCASENVSADDLNCMDDSQQTLMQQNDDVASDVEPLAKSNDEGVISDGNSSGTDSNSSDTQDESYDDVSAVSIKAEPIQVKYKSNSYFKIKVYDQDGYWITSHDVILKVWTGKVVKKFTLKTDSKGLAKFSTKKLKVGTHKVEVIFENSTYYIGSSAVSKIIIKKKIPVYSTSIKVKSSKSVSKKLKSGDKIKTIYSKGNKNRVDGVYAEIKDVKNPIHTKIKKAKFIFKNKKTGRLKIMKANKIKNKKNGARAQHELVKGYKPYKVKIWYIKHSLYD